MAIHTCRLTPEALLEAPVCSHPISSVSGDLVVYTQRNYSFRSRSEAGEIRVRDIKSPRSWAIANNPHASHPRWLGHSEQLLWLEAMANGHTRFVVGDARLRNAPYVVGIVPRPVQNLKVGSVAFREDCDDDLSFAVEKSPHYRGTTNHTPWAGCGLPQNRGLGGTISSPTVNAAGTVALLCKKEDGYAADKNRIVLVSNFQTGESKEIFASTDGRGQWDLSPSAISFASDGSLLIQVDQKGRRVLYQLSLKFWPNKPTPADLKLFDGLVPFGSVVDVKPLPGKSKQALVSCDSFHRRGQFVIQDLPSQDSRNPIPLAPSDEDFGLTGRQIDEVWFPGDDQRRIHAWVVKPSYFNPKQKYPLLYVVHGGPQDSWKQSWDIRCHLVLFAEHGYIVVAPNPTGSTGYGQEFTNAIQRSWAGKAHSDLQKGFDYICQSLEYVDSKRAVALGLGYGGYMINWIQGHDMGRKFKALITDNGVFNLLSHLSNDTLHSILNGLGGPPWANPEEWRKWDPAQHARELEDTTVNHSWETESSASCV